LWETRGVAGASPLFDIAQSAAQSLVDNYFHARVALLPQLVDDRFQVVVNIDRLSHVMHLPPLNSFISAYDTSIIPFGWL
jgi:hypothetical protein